MATAAPVHPDAPHQGVLTRHPLISFFIMAYAFSWIAWAPWNLSEDGLGLLPYYPSDALSGAFLKVGLLFGPFMSAFIMAYVTAGRAGISRLLRRFELWRVGLRWHLFVLVGIPAILFVGALVVPGALASFHSLPLLPTLFSYLPFFVVVMVFEGPLLEETGWRGFALPRLQQLLGPLVRSLILGALWGLWHLPQFFSPSWDTPEGSVLDVVLFVIFAIAVAIILTWVFNNTRGSLIPVTLAHTSIDAFGAAILFSLLPAKVVSGSLVSYVIGFGVVALLVVVFTRGRLGYRQEEPDSAALTKGESHS